MKKSLILGLLIIIALAGSVLATASISSTDISFGGENQRKSNPDADDDEDQEYRIRDTVTITNTGNETISDLALDSTTADPSRFNLNVSSITKTTLMPGETSIVELEITVPEDFDAVDNNLEPGPFDIGTAKFRCNATGVFATSNLRMQVENMLEIDRVKVRVGDLTKEIVSDTEEDVKDLKPSDEVELVIRIENNYRDRDPEDIELEDIEIRIENDDLDVDEEESIDSIDPDETDEITLVFEIDEDQDEDDYDLIILVEATDEFGARHGERWIMTLEVEREEYEIAIREVELSPEVVDNCLQRNVNLEVTVKNIGARDDDEFAIEVSAPSLAFSDSERDIELEENEEEIYTFQIPITTDIDPGDHFIQIEAFFQDDEPSNADDITLTVNACQTGDEDEEDDEEEQEDEEDMDEEEQEDEEDEEEQEDEEDEEQGTPIIVGKQPVSSVEGGFTSSTAYIVILVIAIIIAVASLILTFVLLFRPKR